MATMLPNTTGQADLRDEHIDRIVKGFALQEYRLKDVVMVQGSSSWQESYFQENKDELTGGSGSSIKGVPRLANFPYVEENWTKKTATMVKHAAEAVISYEDERTNNVDVVSRTLLRIARAVAKSVDDDIWSVISENQSPSLINYVSITAGYEWDSATTGNQNPIQDILNAKKELEIDNYDPDKNGYLLLSPKDYANLLGNANVRNAGQFYTDSVTRNGVVGRLLGLTVIKSNSITNDYAMVVVGKECATYKQAVPLTTVSVKDPGIKRTIRCWEIGCTQLTNPEAVCLITNTQA
jgi:hypothetical protein